MSYHFAATATVAKYDFKVAIQSSGYGITNRRALALLITTYRAIQSTRIGPFDYRQRYPVRKRCGQHTKEAIAPSVIDREIYAGTTPSAETLRRLSAGMQKIRHDASGTDETTRPPAADAGSPLQSPSACRR